MNPYRTKIPADEPVRSFGDRFGYWFQQDTWKVGALVLGLFVGVPIAAVVGSVCWVEAADANRDAAALHHDEAIAQGACRDTWLSTVERVALSCPNVQHRLTANDSWIRCECKK